LSNSLDVEFCLEALDNALDQGTPEIFNTDQGSQFTSGLFTERLSSRSIEISMGGRGRALDNVFIERLWRSVKYEDIYLKEYESGADCQRGLTSYFQFSSHERPHQSLDFPGRAVVQRLIWTYVNPGEFMRWRPADSAASHDRGDRQRAESGLLRLSRPAGFAELASMGVSATRSRRALTILSRYRPTSSRPSAQVPEADEVLGDHCWTQLTSHLL